LCLWYLVCILLYDFIAFFGPVGHLNFDFFVAISVLITVFINLLIDLIENKLWRRNYPGGV
jgi:hypothetical protein